MPRRRMTRGYTRRPRKPTFWMNGSSFNLDTFEATLVDDDTGAPFCYSVVLPIVDDEDLADFDEGFHLRRMVGDLFPVFATSGEFSKMPTVPVDCRMTVQMLKTYEGSDPVNTVELLNQLHAHPFSEAELGDEDIIYSARMLQPSWDELASGSLGKLDFAQTLQGFGSWTDTVAGAGITPLVAVFNIATAYPDLFRSPSRFRDFSWKGNRTVRRDIRPYLCFDWTPMDGVIDTQDAGMPEVLGLSGYLRYLVTGPSLTK